MKRKNLLKAFISMSLLSMTSVTVMAADNVEGQGTGVAIGTGSNAQKDGVVAIGKNAHTNYAGGSGYANVNGDVAIGMNATTHSYYDQSGSVAIGKNSYVENTVGQQEKLFAFKQTTFSGFLGLGSLPLQPDKVVTGVSIGDNTYVRTGGTMIGSHNYRGKIGDITVDTDSYETKRKAGLGLYSTTVGANSFTNGTLATTSGALNVISSDYDGNDVTKATKNFGATISGSLNSIESATATNNFSGLANSVVGTANRTFNSNGSLIFGAGNEITNSIGEIGTPLTNSDSVTTLSGKIRTLVKSSNSGGSTMAFGGGNKADYTLRSSMIGVNNTLTGIENNESVENLVTGFQNTAKNVDNTTIIGTSNTVTDSEKNIVIGDKHKVTGKSNNVILGSVDNEVEHTAENTVVIGHNAKANVDGGVALGYKSVASRTATEANGYDLEVGGSSSLNNSTWKPTDSAVSVGDGTTVTRRITSVAAGLEDTDAVNVAQLKKAIATHGGGNNQPNIYAGDTSNVTINPGSTLNIKGGATDLTENNIGVVADGTDTLKVKLAKNVTGLNSVESKEVKAETVKVGDNITITNNGQDMGNTKITNLADGTDPGDAVNLRQLKRVESKLGKVGAGAAALAGLHPLDFDPDDKWNFAAGYGNYAGHNAAAIGAFYRPNEDTMFSVAGTIGNGENMVNAGVSFKLGQANGVTNSRVAMAKEIEDLKGQVQQLTSLVRDLAGGNTARAAVTKNVIFPDVPTDHWAYGYVKGLADRGFVEGYPDGNFKGDRAMTRYEFAALVYRAIVNGAPSDANLARFQQEFGPELNRVAAEDRFRVDRVAGEDNDRHKIERVRVNNKDNKDANDYRDVYGSHVTK